MFSTRTFLARFHEFCRRRRLLEDRARVIAAVSGGVDSSVLLDLLVKERETLGLTVVVAHFNHRLRGDESDGDEEFVAQRAVRYGLEFYVERANTAEYARHNKLGIQEAARILRYQFFERLLVSGGFDKIATAHNADDNAETVLLNLFRGAGVQGLSGIPIYRPDKRIIRPMLFAQRKEIELYAEEEKLSFRNDSSNEKDHYTRNFIRHQILPPVKEQINPTVVQTLLRSSELFRELEAYLLFNARHNLDLVVLNRDATALHLSISRLRSHPTLLQQYIVMIAAEDFIGKRLEFDQVNRVLELMDGLTGSSVTLSEQCTAFRDRDSLVIRKMDPVSEFRIVIQQNTRYEFSRFRFTSEILEGIPVPLNGNGFAEYVDADKVHADDLVLRTWSEGDSFIPLGMKARKKISDFFVDEKIPVYEKKEYPILETKGGEVIWLCGQRIDDRFKITEGTQRVLKLEFARLAGMQNGDPHQGQR
jgi:tRNA(Ile)-lysidine synthase